MMPKDKPIEIGKRVIVRVPNREPREGVITGEGRKGHWWNVKLDGNKGAVGIHKDYCIIADEPGFTFT